jgi:hypothetical protein
MKRKKQFWFGLVLILLPIVLCFLDGDPVKGARESAKYALTLLACKAYIKMSDDDDDDDENKLVPIPPKT